MLFLTIALVYPLSRSRIPYGVSPFLLFFSSNEFGFGGFMNLHRVVGEFYFLDDGGLASIKWQTTLLADRAPLDFDLKVADEISFEDVAYRGSLESGAHDRSSVGFDLDLNRLDETPEAGSFSIGKMDIPLPSKQPSLSSGLSNGGSVSRDFDLNNGPGLDEVSTEVPTRTPQMKSTIPFSTSVHSTRTNNTEFGNYSSWFSPGNSYSAITVRRVHAQSSSSCVSKVSLASFV
ncbi:hypothetical protein KIW84_024543 [Lathyrus oleraceus]|uniref:Uncharacterized protein n=1 Tax=Pisum sativum TaxID=3888 RepID=A0A9D4YGT3_PEA|nr:hypothetical protein KIW84_031426 [Pisum sativum]KAI5438854.1 hypothetical protein KIW84_024541 [Pisum sativum]KAI5438856.1 hypothetical protein KIW84_024543 [Pisum sativum]